MIFKDREDAGRQLARRLNAYANRKDVIVLGIPRGGVPVAFEIAQALNVPMDIFLSRKLGVPGNGRTRVRRDRGRRWTVPGQRSNSGDGYFGTAD